MTINTSFTKLFRHITCAVLASSVTSFVGLISVANADTEARTCSLRDASAWQLQLVEATEEITPAYILGVTEAFLDKCPDRPEFREASKIAGMAATDNGEIKRAVAHFENAGVLYDERAQFYQAAALLADNQDAKAWNIRDRLVNSWLEKLARNPQAAVDVKTLRTGIIYTVTFAQPDSESGIGAAWVAVPYGAGWPATLTIGAERQVTAFHRLRAGADAPALAHVDYYRCRGRRLLARAPVAIPMSEMEAAARVTLIGYLAAPDDLDETKDGQALATCLWPQRLLPRPAR